MPRVIVMLVVSCVVSCVVAAEATSTSYRMELDDSVVGGGQSASTTTTMQGSVVTMLNKRSVTSLSALQSGFIGTLKAVNNQQPVFASLTAVTAVDTPVMVALLATDADGEPLLFGTGTPMPGTIQAFASNTGIFTWLPPVGATGVFSLPVTVTDGFGSAVVGTVTVTVSTPQIVVSPSGTLITSESGGQSSLAIVLTAPPTGVVTVPVVSSRPTEVLPSVTMLTFSPTDWNSAHSVTLIGQPDGVTDGTQTCQIQIGPSVGQGTNFDGVASASVTVLNLDQDIPALVINESNAGTSVGESGTIDSYTVALSSRPSGPVTITLAADPQLRLGTTVLSFTDSTWSTPQTVTVAAVDDLLTQGNRSVFIVHTASGGGYAGMPSRTLAVSMVDNDSAALVLAPASVTVSETGTTAQVQVTLASQPNATVVISAASGDPQVAGCSPTTLTFAPGAWNVPQALTITGVDDGNVASGNRSFSIGLTASGDAGYAGIVANVSGLCLDNDSKNLVISTAGSMQVSEGSAQSVSYSVRLSQAPSAPVVVALANPDGYVQVTPATVTFSTSDWMIPQVITVRAVDDAIAQGPHQAIITHAWNSSDPGYVSSVSLSLTVAVADNDRAGFTITPVSGLVTTEIGGSDVFFVRLNSQPIADVQVPIVSADSDQVTVNQNTLTFTSSTWNQPQTVVVRGADGNARDDGDVAFAILVGNASSGDAGYQNLAGGNVTGTNRAVDHAPTIDGPLTASVGGIVTTLVTLSGERTLIVNEDSGMINVSLTGISNGQSGENQAVSVTATSDTPGLTGSPTISYQNPQSVGLLSIAPLLHANGNAWISLAVSDGGSNPPASIGFRLVVNAVDTPPTVDRSTAAVVAYRGIFSLIGLQANAFAPGQLACSDVETPASALSIILSVPPQKGVLQRWEPLSAAWVVLGQGEAFTQTDVDNDYIRYVHTDTSGALNDGLQFTVRDSGNQTAGGAMAITIDPNKPSVDLLPAAAIAFREGDIPLAVAPSATLFNPVASLSGGSLVFTVARGDASDRLTMQSGGNITVTNAGVLHGATIIGTVSGSGSTLVVTFTANATTLMAEELARQVFFSNASEDPSASQRTLTAVLTNSLGFASAPANRFLVMTPVNDPPTANPLHLVAVAGVPVSATPDIADVDGPARTVSVQTPPLKGDLTIDNPATGAFTYRPWPGQSGPDTFALAINDNAPDLSGSISLTVGVAITGPSTVLRPWIYSRPPVEALAGDLLQWTVQVDTSDLTNPQLVFSTSGAPSGLQLIADSAAATADVSWSLPSTLNGDVSFTVVVTDPVSGTAAAQVVTLYVHPLPRGAQ